MGRKSGTASASKISSASTLAVSPKTSSSNKSSIIRSAFAPSYLQLRLFASVIQSFDSQQLRLHDIYTGRLKQQHSARPGSEITCLDWGHYGISYRESRLSNKKKRKRTQGHEDAEDAVLAYGTTSSEICMYSPAEGALIGTLVLPHQAIVKDFKFVPEDNLQAWSIDSHGKLVGWDLQKDQAIRTILLPDSDVQTLAFPSSLSPQILCASYTSFTIDHAASDDFRIESYDKFKHPIHTLIRSGSSPNGDSELFIAANDDRYLNIFDISQKKILQTLITRSEIERTAMFDPISESKNPRQEQMLAVITREGMIEMFSHPFIQPKHINGDLRAKRKSMTRKADASIRLMYPDGSKKSVAAFNASFQGPDLVIVSVDGGIDPVFQKVRWQDEGSGELLFEGTKEVVRVKSATALNGVTMNGAKDVGRTNVDESNVVVVNGLAQSESQPEAIEISSSEDEKEEDETDSEEEQPVSKDESSADSDADMEDADSVDINGQEIQKTDAEMQNDEPEEPTFGDLLAARHPHTIEIGNNLAKDQSALINISSSRKLVVPNGSSLGTVLSQALRTNDQSLLESCLHETKDEIIQNTTLRIDSSLAAILLTKLAERLATKPGRWGHLLIWVQLTMIAHGGAIAGQPDVASKLRILYQVLNERSKVLPKILLLKGKLDMLSAQQAFREQAEAQRAISRIDRDEPGMIYIEGQEENWSSEDDLDEESRTGAMPKSISKPRKDLADLVSAEESDDEDMPLANGLSTSGSEDDDASDADNNDNINAQKPGGLLDNEAEVSGEDESGQSEDDESGDDVDGEEDEEEDDNEEEDSSLDDFINDGSISEVSDELDRIDVDEEADHTPQKPPAKRSRHR